MSVRIGTEYCKGCEHRVVCGIWNDCTNNELFEEWQQGIVTVQITRCEVREKKEQQATKVYLLKGDEDGEDRHNENVRRVRKGKQR